MITSCLRSKELTSVVQRGLWSRLLRRHPQAPWTVGVSLFSYTAARWGIAASPAALSFIKGRARAKAPYQQDRTLAVAQPPKTSVVLRDSGGLTSNRKRHAPIRGEGTRAVGWGIWLNSSEEACGP